MASKPNTSRQHKHFSVLIDADNAPAAIVEGLFEEIAKYGIASVKRIYGDWKKVLLSTPSGRSNSLLVPRSRTPLCNSPLI